MYNVYDWQRTVSGGSPSKSQALTAFKASIQAPLLNCLSVSYIGDFSDVRWLDDPLDPFTTTTNASNGQVTLDSLPSINNVYMKLGTGFRGGSNRGAKRFGPIAESSTTLDQLNAGAITLFGTFSTAYLAGFTAADGFVYKPFLVSQIQSTFTPTSAVVKGNLITSTTLNPVLGRLLRRAEFHKSAQ